MCVQKATTKIKLLVFNYFLERTIGIIFRLPLSKFSQKYFSKDGGKNRNLRTNSCLFICICPKLNTVGVSTISFSTILAIGFCELSAVQ
jgi:hypothetical protein